MTTIEVFTPSWCPAPYLCHDDAPEACRLTADLEWLGAQGVRVATCTLTDDAHRFVEHDAVRFLTNVLGSAALPVILVDGVLRSVGRYPDRTELAGYVGLEAEGVAVPGLETVAVDDALVELAGAGAVGAGAVGADVLGDDARGASATVDGELLGVAFAGHEHPDSPVVLGAGTMELDHRAGPELVGVPTTRAKRRRPVRGVSPVSSNLRAG